MDQLKQQLLEQYNKHKANCYVNKILAPYGAMKEEKCPIGQYSFVKLYSFDDIYNHAFEETSYHYIFDKEGTPHFLCKTEAGNANEDSSSLDEISRNQKLVNSVIDSLILINSNPLFNKSKIKQISDRLETCLKNDDFSSFNIDDLTNHSLKRVIKRNRDKLASQYGLRTIAAVRFYKTREEFYGPQKETTHDKETSQSQVEHTKDNNELSK